MSTIFQLFSYFKKEAELSCFKMAKFVPVLPVLYSKFCRISVPWQMCNRAKREGNFKTNPFWNKVNGLFPEETRVLDLRGRCELGYFIQVFCWTFSNSKDIQEFQLSFSSFKRLPWSPFLFTLWKKSCWSFNLKTCRKGSKIAGEWRIQSKHLDTDLAVQVL